MLFEDITTGIFGLPNTSELCGLDEAFFRGSSFMKVYSEYKGMKYVKLIPKNEKERLLYKIYAYDFGINDLSLYLDLHPEDLNVYAVFQSYCQELEILKKNYEVKYGPLDLIDTDGITYNWLDNPWPWESEETMYV